jgi:phosphatidylserine/phosphatidylglycerophosphate/cardiolipin synthase-like enzyme
MSSNVPSTERDAALPGGFLRPGRNCWRIERASRATVLVDGADYFATLDEALRSARRSIDIVGWDFDGRIRLRPDVEGSPALGDLLRGLVDSNPALTVRVLVWSTAVMHAPSAPAPLLFGTPWEQHPRIAVRLDREHPIYASHHQKIVVIDDALAFCGGIDLTVDRWDTTEHRPHHRYRRDPDGAEVCPVHDLQMMVEGDAARALGEHVRERWRRATGEVLPARLGETGDLWPERCEPMFRNVTVGIARTMPAWRGEPPVEEIAALTVDLIGAARRSMYVEAQYFCGRELAACLEQKLRADQAPEVAVVAGSDEKGVVERWIMGNNRERLIRKLRRIDRSGRFKVYRPLVAGDDRPEPVLVHAKLTIVDDWILRLGSANLNNRSMGVDTECDLVIEAHDDETCSAIAALRNRLVAEHIGATPEIVAAATAEKGLLGAIGLPNGNGRRLDPFPIRDEGPTRRAFGTALLDPRRPLEPMWMRRTRRPSSPAPLASQHDFAHGEEQPADHQRDEKIGQAENQQRSDHALHRQQMQNNAFKHP